MYVNVLYVFEYVIIYVLAFALYGNVSYAFAFVYVFAFVLYVVKYDL